MTEQVQAKRKIKIIKQTLQQAISKSTVIPFQKPELPKYQTELLHKQILQLKQSKSKSLSQQYEPFQQLTKQAVQTLTTIINSIQKKIQQLQYRLHQFICHKIKSELKGIKKFKNISRYQKKISRDQAFVIQIKQGKETITEDEFWKQMQQLIINQFCHGHRQYIQQLQDETKKLGDQKKLLLDIDVYQLKYPKSLKTIIKDAMKAIQDSSENLFSLIQDKDMKSILSGDFKIKFA